MKAVQEVRSRMIHFEGDISSQNVIHVEKQLLAVLASEQADCLLLNMSKVNFIDSAGLAMIAKAFTLAKSQSKSLKLHEVSHSVRLAFELTGLDRVIQLSD